MNASAGGRRAREARRYVLLGTFAIGALLVLALGLALFFGGRFQGGRTEALMVFRGTVTGLEVGTPVQFRGIKIGEVRSIRTIYDPDTKQVSFATIAEFSGNIEIQGRKQPIGAQQGAWIEDMVARGLRARLQTRSFVTGQQMVFLDFDAAGPPVLSNLGLAPVEIPTARSATEEITDRLSELPVGEIVDQGQKLLTGINALLVDQPGRPAPLPQLVARLGSLVQTVESRVPDLAGDVGGASREAQRTLVEAREALAAFTRVARNLDAQVAGGGEAIAGTARQAEVLVRQAEGTLTRLDAAVGRVDGTLARVEHALSEDAPLGASLTSTLSEATATAQSLRRAIDALNRKPDALLFGRQPQQ